MDLKLLDHLPLDLKLLDHLPLDLIVILSWPSFHLVTIFRDRQVKSPQQIATTTQRTTALQELMSDQSAKSLTKTWLRPGKKVRKTKKVKIGDHVDIMFEGRDYFAVVSKINKITFIADFADGSDAMPEIKNQRGPRNPDGVWQFNQDPVIDEDEFVCFQVLEEVLDSVCCRCRSPAPIWTEPKDLSWCVFTSKPEWRPAWQA